MPAADVQQAVLDEREGAPVGEPPRGERDRRARGGAQGGGEGGEDDGEQGDGRREGGTRIDTVREPAAGHHAGEAADAEEQQQPRPQARPHVSGAVEQGAEVGVDDEGPDHPERRDEQRRGRVADAEHGQSPPYPRPARPRYRRQGGPEPGQRYQGQQGDEAERPAPGREVADRAAQRHAQGDRRGHARVDDGQGASPPFGRGDTGRHRRRGRGVDRRTGARDGPAEQQDGVGRREGGQGVPGREHDQHHHQHGLPVGGRRQTRQHRCGDGVGEGEHRHRLAGRRRGQTQVARHRGQQPRDDEQVRPDGEHAQRQQPDPGPAPAPVLRRPLRHGHRAHPSPYPVHRSNRSCGYFVRGR